MKRFAVVVFGLLSVAFGAGSLKTALLTSKSPSSLSWWLRTVWFELAFCFIMLSVGLLMIYLTMKSVRESK